MVMDGSLTVYLNDEAYRLDKGDSMLYPSTIPHRYRCNGAKPAVVVMAETPMAFFNVLRGHLTAGNIDRGRSEQSRDHDNPETRLD